MPAENHAIQLHESGEDYLEAILVLGKRLPVVRAVDIARELGYKKSSISVAVKRLQDGGFITVSAEKYITLTEAGRRVAEKIYERHCFFAQQLIAVGVNPETAEADACRIEHVISSETFARIRQANQQAVKSGSEAEIQKEEKHDEN